MATLQSYVDKLPAIFRLRYTTAGFFVQWLNELLEELQDRGFMPNIKKEAGRVVIADRWIEKPADFISLIKVFDPDDRNRQIRVQEIENKLELMDYDIVDQAAAEQVTFTTVSDGTTTSVKVNLTGIAADSWEEYLFLVTAGTYAGKGYVISGNDVSGATTTKIDFLHALPSALDGTKCSAGRIVPLGYYVLMQYIASFEEITAQTDEVPIDNKYEKRIVPAWLQWKCNTSLSMTSSETMVWAQEVDRILGSVESARNSRPVNQAKGRRLVGLEKSYRNTDSDDRSFTSVYGA